MSIQLYDTNDVANRYGVIDQTVRNWIDIGILGANVRRVKKRRYFKITPEQVAAFEKLTGAVPVMPWLARTRWEIQHNITTENADRLSRDYRLVNLHRARRCAKNM